jgi:subtilisin family serine protease
MKLRLLIASLAIVVVASAATAGASPAPRFGRTNVAAFAPDAAAKLTEKTPAYIIELDGEPAATYQGGVSDLAATSPLATGAVQLDAEAPATVAYVDYLLARQASFAETMNRALGRDVQLLFNYRFVLNGVAAAISAQEAEIVAGLPGVLRVTANTMEHVDTDAGPEWIGAKGVWDGTGVPGGVGTMGEGVIVGVLDTGINMDHPSFAAIGPDGYEHVNPFGAGRYKGWCDPENPNYNASYLCNAKLIGLWSMTADATPEDDDGHGSHTASTAAGNIITASMASGIIAPTQVRGVAPHANIIMYDVCSGGCPTVALAAALDQALNDGVHVINYSISGTGGALWTDENPIQRGFRNLRYGGISSAVSAGNAGPSAGSTAALGPWMASVAASTHNRAFVASVQDMTGGDTPPPATLAGKAIAGDYGPAPIVHAAGYTNISGQPDDGLCLVDFPPGTFPNGEIVVCDRGIAGRVEKGGNVLAGGAGGYVLANDEANGNSLVADVHELPAVHLSYDNGVILKAWLASGTGHMATLSGTTMGRDPSNADVMASFSGRGPGIWGPCCLRPWGILGGKLLDILKPDVTAPGVDIIAAWSTDPDDPATEPEFNAISGTSMSGPHMAGAFALMKALYPEWTVAERQSALMLTAITDGLRKEDQTTPADPMDFGAGRIYVSNAASTGLVMDMTMDEAMAANPEVGGDPSTLNLASLANYHCSGGCSWTRTVKSVWDEEVTWELSASGSSGLALSVMPATLTIQPGETAVISVTADVNDVPVDSFAFGRVTLEPSQPGPSPAHLNAAVLSQAITFPSAVKSEIPPLAIGFAHSTEGEWVISGFTSQSMEDLTASSVGFLVPEQQDTTLPPDPTPTDPWDSDEGTVTSLITVPEGALRVVAETKSSTAVDIDLFLGIDLNGDGLAQSGETACASQGETWQEFCDIRNPPAATWWVRLQNWAGGTGPTDELSYLYGALTADGTGMTVSAPTSVTEGEPWDLRIGWDVDAIEPGDVFYGVAMLDSAGVEVMNLAFDLLGTEGPSPVFLPDVRNRFIYTPPTPVPTEVVPPTAVP